MLIDHVFARTATWSGPQQGAPRPGLLYEYVVASNGDFVRAQRQGLAVQIPIFHRLNPMKGLLAANMVVHLPQRVPMNILNYMVVTSRQNMPDEILFYLDFVNAWRLSLPVQKATRTRCAPVDPYSESSRRAIVEVHSHNSMGAFFSDEDDKDETGFKIYAVLGRLDTDQPEISVRVGVYGHRTIVPADLVFNGLDLVGVEDVNF